MKGARESKKIILFLFYLIPFFFLSFLIFLVAFFPKILKKSLAGISFLFGAGLFTDKFFHLKSHLFEFQRSIPHSLSPI